MITAVDPSATTFEMLEKKPRLSQGRHLLRCVRFLEARKDGSHYTDKDGDRKCLAIFESDSYPNHEGIFQAVYDSRHSITTDRDAKLGRTASFVGKFIHCAGVPQIEKLEDMVELTAYGEVVHKGQFTNIQKWLIPETQKQQSSSSKPDLNEDAPSISSNDEGQRYVEDDVPF